MDTTADDISFGWIGDIPRLLTAHLFADASLADCPYTSKSGSGVHFDIQGPNSRFPIAAECNTQTSTASSSTASEVSALNGGMKTRAKPALGLLSLCLAKYHYIGDEASGGSEIVQCQGFFDPPDRIKNHYRSEHASLYVSEGSGGRASIAHLSLCRLSPLRSLFRNRLR